MSATLRISGHDHAALAAHLFREDRDEYGAVILSGASHRGPRTRLLCRELHLLSEDEFTVGEHGYRQITAAALARLGARACAEGLGIITCHSHPGSTTATRLSADDRAGHRRVFPHLLDIVDGEPVGGIAFGEECADGELYTSEGAPQPIEVEVLGGAYRRLGPGPPQRGGGAEARFDRQVRMFGDSGQALLGKLEVAVIGAGGGGSIVIEQLAHLGVGKILAVDHDVVKPHNLSRIVGAATADAQTGTKKVEVARRLVARIDPKLELVAIDGDLADRALADRVAQSDFILLCTDTITSRLVANAIAASHLVPMVQIGAKVDVIEEGRIESIYVAVRPVIGGEGCLACAKLIDPIALQEEAASPAERAAQNYLGKAEVIDPSVITLNGVAASAATNLMLMWAVGLGQEEALAHRLFDARSGSWLSLRTARRPECRWCGGEAKSVFGRGDRAELPVRHFSAAVEPEREVETHRRRRRRWLPWRRRKG